MENKHEVIYFAYIDKNPVKEFIAGLDINQQTKIFRLFRLIANYGINSIPQHTRKITNTPLWEIRILGNDNIRIIYIITKKQNILILHGFIKKTRKTEMKEIQNAIRRLKEWSRAINIDK